MRCTTLPFLFLLLIGGTLLLSAPEAQAQTGRVQGAISDGETGDLLPGATVMIKGTALGSATDTDGRFVISRVPAGSQTLVITSVGFKEQEVTLEVPAGGSVTESVGLEASATQLDDLVITGLRKSQIDAINVKRSAINTKEVLTTNDIGRLPDINVAEATQRVSGVSIETDRGEGRFVSIRGIQPALNNVTLNNTNLASSNNGRATALDLVPVESISSIEVTKVVTPDMEANSVGGAVNINTISAFDRQKPFVIASVDALLQEQQAEYGDDKLPFRAAVTAGKRFGEKERFGAVVSANFFRRDFSASVQDPDEWIYISQGDGSPAYFVPNEIEIQIEDNERDRLGFTTDFEYRPTEFSSIYLRGLYTRTTEKTLNSEAELTIEDGDLTNQTPTSGRFSLGSSELDLSGQDETENLVSLTLGGKNRFGNLTAEAYGTYSLATSLNNVTDGTFENPEETEPDFANTYNTAPYFFVIEPENPEIATDPSVHLLRSLNFITSDVAQDAVEGSLDLRYDLGLGDLAAFVKVGGRYRKRTISVDVTRDQYGLDGGDGGGDIAEAENPYRLSDGFYLEPFAPVQGGTTPLVNGDAEKFIGFFANPANLNPDRIVFQPFESAFENVENDLNNSEEVAAGYAMFSVDFVRTNITAGVRLEQTTTTSTRLISSFDDDTETFDFRQETFSNTYTNLLPAIILRSNLTDQLVARASWTNTIGRPNFTDLSATTEFEYVATSTEGVYEGELQEGNPNLKPFESMNLDASLEYYFPSGGILAVGGFYKDIKNQIYEVETNFRDTTYAGRFFEELAYQRDVNAEAAQLYGLEASYDQAFTFLPGFWGGFGITANVALINSDVTVAGREEDDLPLFRQPSNIYNIIPYFQRNGWEFRVAVSHRGDFLLQAALPTQYDDEVELGATVADFDRYEDVRTTVDITGAYTFPNRRLKILAQARNLTNEPEAAYQGNRNRYDRHTLVGRTYFLGASLNF